MSEATDENDLDFAIAVFRFRAGTHIDNEEVIVVISKLIL